MSNKTNRVSLKGITIHLPTKRILWSNDADEIRHVVSHKDIIDCCPEAATNRVTFNQIQSDMLNDAMQFIKQNAGYACNEIVCIGIINDRNGRFIGIKEIRNNAIRNCFSLDDFKHNDEITFGIDEYKNLVAVIKNKEITVHRLYRAYKPLLSDKQIKNFENKVKSGRVTNYDVSVYTENLSQYMRDILI